MPLLTVQDWEQQICPICKAPLSRHVLISQDISADFSMRKLRLDADVFCEVKKR
jgi:hypothetical protein